MLRKVGVCDRCSASLYGDEYGAAGHKCNNPLFEMEYETLESQNQWLAAQNAALLKLLVKCRPYVFEEVENSRPFLGGIDDVNETHKALLDAIDEQIRKEAIDGK